MTAQGTIFDLGPDGYGFIRRDDCAGAENGGPEKKGAEVWAFSIRRMPENVAPQDGMRVEIDIARGKVVAVRPLPRRRAARAASGVRHPTPA